MIMKVANGGYTLALLPLNRKKVRLNSAFSSQILSAIVYRSSHFFRKFDIGLRKMQTCPWALDQKQLQTTLSDKLVLSVGNFPQPKMVEKKSLQTNMNKENTCTYYHTRLPIELGPPVPVQYQCLVRSGLINFPHGYNIKTKRTFKALMT